MSLQQVYPGMPWLRGHIQTANPIDNAIRSVSYGILCALAHAVDALEGTVNKVLGTNIMVIQPVQDLVNKFQSLSWAILVIALSVAGVVMILYGNKHKELFQHALTGVILMISVPFIFSTLNQFRDAGVGDVQSMIGGASDAGEELLRSNVINVDASQSSLQFIGSSGDLNTLPTADSINIWSALHGNMNPYYININMTLANTAPWQYKVDSIVGDGGSDSDYKMYGEPLGSGMFGWGSEAIYAFSYNFWYTFVVMIIMLIALVLAGFKIARTMFDIAVHHVLAPPVFASDINGGGRSKKLIVSLISLYIMLILIMVVFKMFMDISTWINGNVSDLGVRVALLAGSAWGVIEGPDIIVRILGVDVGLQNGAQTAMAAMMGLNTVSGIARTVGGTIGKVGNFAGGISALPGIEKALSAGADAAKSGEFASMAEYGSSLPTGRNSFSRGSLGLTNAARSLGYGATTGVGHAENFANHFRKKPNDGTTPPDTGTESYTTQTAAADSAGVKDNSQQTHPDASSLDKAFEAAEDDNSPPPSIQDNIPPFATSNEGDSQALPPPPTGGNDSATLPSPPFETDPPEQSLSGSVSTGATPPPPSGSADAGATLPPSSGSVSTGTTLPRSSEYTSSPSSSNAASNTAAATQMDNIPHGWEAATKDVEQEATHKKTFWPTRREDDK